MARKGLIKRGKRSAKRILFFIALIWVIQLAALFWFFQDFSWTHYWFCRDLYRPGLRLFLALGGDWVPSHYGQPFSRQGAMMGFTFAALVYSLLIVTGVLLIRFWLASRHR